MTSGSPLATAVSGGIAHVTLNRPDKRNALDSATLSALGTTLAQCAADKTVRVLQLTGAGNVFCAGADLTEMQAQAHASETENLAHARTLARVLSTLDSFPKPTLARVNGHGYGGALGLIAACDIVVAVESAKFAFTEVRLGIIPAVVSPFVLGKIGEQAALRYFLTGETMSAPTLKEIGLVHEAVPAELLDATCGGIIDAILKGAIGGESPHPRRPTDSAATRRGSDGHGATTREVKGASGSPRRICGILCQAQSGLAGSLVRHPKGVGVLARAMPNPLAILEDGVRGLSTW